MKNSLILKQVLLLLMFVVVTPDAFGAAAAPGGDGDQGRDQQNQPIDVDGRRGQKRRHSDNEEKNDGQSAVNKKQRSFFSSVLSYLPFFNSSVDSNQLTEENVHAFVLAAAHGEIDTIKAALNTSPNIINASTDKVVGSNALGAALEFRREEVVKYLLSCTELSFDEGTLFNAVGSGVGQDIIQLIYADPRLKSEMLNFRHPVSCDTVLTVAVRSNLSGIVWKLLCDKRLTLETIKAEDAYGKTALDYAKDRNAFSLITINIEKAIYEREHEAMPDSMPFNANNRSNEQNEKPLPTEVERFKEILNVIYQNRSDLAGDRDLLEQDFAALVNQADSKKREKIALETTNWESEYEKNNSESESEANAKARYEAKRDCLIGCLNWEIAAINKSIQLFLADGQLHWVADLCKQLDVGSLKDAQVACRRRIGAAHPDKTNGDKEQAIVQTQDLNELKEKIGHAISCGLHCVPRPPQQ